MKNIDKIVPTSAIILSTLCMLFVVNHLLSAEGYLKEEYYNQIGANNDSILDLDNNTNKDQIILSAFIDLDKVSDGFEISEEKINKIYQNIINKQDIKTEDIINKYNNGAFKILIVPGHDNEYHGAIFRNLTEDIINLELAEYLKNFLDHEKGIEATIVRDKNGYIKSLDKYFKTQENQTKEFIFNHKIATQNLIKNNLYKTNQVIIHNHAEFEVVKRLYGINKWSSEEGDFDMVIHIHFNDYPRNNHSIKGKYNGFSIYIPERQFNYSEPSRELAENIANLLKDYFPQSNMPMEFDNLIESQDLIALGANHTINYPSILIEYDYLYEDQYKNEDIRKFIVKEKAYRTYLGIMSFLGKDVEINLSVNPEAYLNSNKEKISTSNKTNLIHNLEKDLWLSKKNSKDVVSLQSFLKREGYYGLETNRAQNCPISGNFDFCTQRALKDFQYQNGLAPTGFVGEATRKLINGII